MSNYYDATDSHSDAALYGMEYDDAQRADDARATESARRGAMTVAERDAAAPMSVWGITQYNGLWFVTENGERVGFGWNDAHDAANIAVANASDGY